MTGITTCDTPAMTKEEWATFERVNEEGKRLVDMTHEELRCFAMVYDLDLMLEGEELEVCVKRLNEGGW